MKNTFLTFLIVCWSFLANAQFEGSIVWNFKMEITDPKMKAQMEQANTKMNSPEMQAQMKDMEVKMNDPEFKAMMESNPEMKAMIEKQLEAARSGSGGNMYEKMMPKSVSIKIKNSNSLTNVVGGPAENEMLFLKANELSYSIDRKNKTYSLVPKSENEKASEYKVSKTTETATIFGYKCQKYIVEMMEKGYKIINNVWATTDIKDLDARQFSKMKFSQSQNSNFMDKIEGVPLKMQMTLPQGQIIMEVTSLKKEPLKADLFEIPAGFTEVKK